MAYAFECDVSPEETSEPEQGVLAAVNGLLSEASDLLTESHPPTEEQYGAEQDALHHISKAKQGLAHSQEVVCSCPGCDRPQSNSGRGSRACAEHDAEFDAAGELEAWEWTQSLVEPWMQTVERIGSPELDQVIRKAFEEVNEKVERARAEHERTVAVLNEAEEAKDA